METIFFKCVVYFSKVSGIFLYIFLIKKKKKIGKDIKIRKKYYRHDLNELISINDLNNILFIVV